jgi:hypothetical protein
MGNLRHLDPGERMRLHTRLLDQAAAGLLDNLGCPNCAEPSVFVWFTRPAANAYRTWFICADCDFHTRVQNTERPQSFSEDRVSTDLEERDLLILKKARSKSPPQQLM